MNRIYRKSLVAGVIATLLAAPGWAFAEQQQTRTAPYPAPPGQTMHEEQGQPGMAHPSQGVYGKTPKELQGMEIRGTNGNEVATLKDLVVKHDARQIYAVISVGGILGVGAKEVVVPLDELRLQGDQLHILGTKDDLMRRQVYAATQYRELQPENRPIGEFAAFEAQPEGQPR